MRVCSKCRREPAIYRVRKKSFMGAWGTDCLFALKGIYRSADGWKCRGWSIERIEGMERTPSELAQTEARKQIDRAKERAKAPARFWHRVLLECVAQSTGLARMGAFAETWLVRKLARAIRFLREPNQLPELVNEVVARRFPDAKIETKVS